jgi:hypothetical protein
MILRWIRGCCAAAYWTTGIGRDAFCAARQLLFYLLLEFLFRHLTGFVQPDCTIEVLPVLGEDVKSGLRQAPFAAGPETV